MEKQSAKLALVLLFIFQIAKANVLINEVCWMGDGISSSNEWVELYNNTDKDINIDNWQIKISDKKIVNLKGTISSQEFYVLSRNKDQGDLNYNKALNNNGEKIELADENNNIIDSIDFSGGWTYGDNTTKQTMERIESGWQTSLNPGGTPKQQNSIIEKQQTEIVNKKEYTNYTLLFSLASSFFLGGMAVFFKRLL
jgi:hypothetical protein